VFNLHLVAAFPELAGKDFRMTGCPFPDQEVILQLGPRLSRVGSVS